MSPYKIKGTILSIFFDVCNCDILDDRYIYPYSSILELHNNVYNIIILVHLPTIKLYSNLFGVLITFI